MKRNKRIFSLVAAALLVIGFAACNTNVRPESAAPAPDGEAASVEGGQPAASTDAPKIRLLVRSDRYPTEANIARDLLAKLGFEVELNMQPDYASMRAVLESGQFDVALNSWATVSGNGDYAIRALAYSTGGSNFYGINDSHLDELIDEAATLTIEESKPVYAEVEKIMIEEGYMAPMGMNPRLEAFNKDIIRSDSVGVYVARAKPFEWIDFVDESMRETDPLIAWQTENWYVSADPIRSNENSAYLGNTNMYVRLMNFDDNVQLTTDGTITRSYAIAEGNQEFFFLLRDDIHFATVADKQAVDSGERVGAEDVVYTVNRMCNESSVPEHATYSLFEKISGAEIVTDLAELEEKVDSDSGKSLKETLEQGLSVPIDTVVADKMQANNAQGAYQVVRVSTSTPFPQVMNFLGHYTAGIVSEKAVEAVNSQVDFASYDVSSDVLYGDDSAMLDGPSYNNHLAASGPYIITYRNDYEIVMEKNPGYMPGTENEPRIKTVHIKMIKDKDSALSALRSGEIHMLDSVDENKIDLIEQDEKLELKQVKGVNLIYLSFNTDDSSICADKNVRLAIQNAMDQDAITAIFSGRYYPGQTTISTVLDTGYSFKPDPSKAQGYMDAYLQGQ